MNAPAYNTVAWFQVGTTDAEHAKRSTVTCSAGDIRSTRTARASTTWSATPERIRPVGGSSTPAASSEPHDLHGGGPGRGRRLRPGRATRREGAGAAHHQQGRAGLRRLARPCGQPLRRLHPAARVGARRPHLRYQTVTGLVTFPHLLEGGCARTPAVRPRSMPQARSPRPSATGSPAKTPRWAGGASSWRSSQQSYLPASSACAPGIPGRSTPRTSHSPNAGRTRLNAA